MLGIIPEDSNAGKQFWSAINSELLEDRAIMLDSLNSTSTSLGCNTILPRLKKAVDSGVLKNGSSVLIILDNIGNSSVAVQMKLIEAECKKHDIKLTATTFYCFEELLLSFELLETWINTINDRYIEFLNFVQNSINEKKDCFSNHEGYNEIFNEILCRCKKDKNREQFSYQLLSIVTDKNSGFKTTKSKIGQCWINDCCDTEYQVLASSEKIKAYKRLCGISKCSLKSKDKLLIICKKSVLSKWGTKIEDLIKVL